MYADRYAGSGGIRPGSLTVAIAINGALIGALLFASPAIRDKLPPTPFDGYNVPIEPPPPDPEPPIAKAQPHQKTLPQPDRVETTTSIAGETAPYTPPPLPDIGPIGSGGGAVDVILPPPPMPVLTEASVDPRYADQFQPIYPPGEQRAEREGRVTIRVLIGIDGRVKQVERVAAASDLFWRATEQRALSKWRFRPATRDGVAVEAWRTMTVRFELDSRG